MFFIAAPVDALSFVVCMLIYDEIELSGGSVAGFIFVINLFDLPGNGILKKKSYFTESLIEFPGH